MTLRNFASTDVLSKLLKSHEVSKVSVICRGDCKINSPKLQQQKVIRPFNYNKPRHFTFKRWFYDILFSLGYYLHLTLINRFNSIQGFIGFENRMRQSKRLHVISAKEGLPTSRWWGFPFRKNHYLYRFLVFIYKHSFSHHTDALDFFRKENIDILVVGHLQNHFVSPYVHAAKKLNIPLIGVNGSWDQPTTKGPIFFNYDQLLTQNNKVSDELTRLHHYDESKITVVGWPQMDIYKDTKILKPRSEFLKTIGLNKTQRYILVGAYSERLGYHEPKMCEALATHLTHHKKYKDVVIYIRSHPLDMDWEKRMGYLRKHSNIFIEPPSSGNLPHLANLINYADCIISSAGTISLDAVALDKPAIAIAFEDETLPYYDRASRRYDMEHYASVMETGGVIKVESQDKLNVTVTEILDNPQLGAQKRQLLRASHLEPLDGKAADRIVSAILKGGK